MMTPKETTAVLAKANERARIVRDIQRNEAGESKLETTAESLAESNLGMCQVIRALVVRIDKLDSDVTQIAKDLIRRVDELEAKATQQSAQVKQLENSHGYRTPGT